MKYDFIISNNEIYLNNYCKLTWEEFIERIKKDEEYKLKFNIGVKKNVTVKVWIKDNQGVYHQEEKDGCTIISFN